VNAMTGEDIAGRPYRNHSQRISALEFSDGFPTEFKCESAPFDGELPTSSNGKISV
jgi:hypothetical protein